MSEDRRWRHYEYGDEVTGVSETNCKRGDHFTAPDAI